MNVGTILSSLVDGLLIGVVYGIAAMGLNLIWGVMRVINLAHGALISLGMFGVYLLFSSPRVQSLPGSPARGAARACSLGS